MQILEREFRGGTQVLHRFDNGYGASVVCSIFSYGGTDGLKELAVLNFDGPGDFDWSIDYSTPITKDVLGYLTDEEVAATLKLIEEL